MGESIRWPTDEDSSWSWLRGRGRARTDYLGVGASSTALVPRAEKLEPQPIDVGISNLLLAVHRLQGPRVRPGVILRVAVAEGHVGSLGMKNARDITPTPLLPAGLPVGQIGH